MSKWMDRFSKPGPGVYTPPPDRGVKRFFFLLPIHIRKLILLNVLWILFSIPIVTLPAASTGVNFVLMKLAREGRCFLWDDFIEAFKKYFVKSLIALPLYLVIAAAVVVFIVAEGPLALLFKILLCILAFLCWLVSCYFFPMLSYIDELSGKELLKNAVLLMLVSAKQDVFLTLFPGLLTALQAIFLPLTAPFLVFLTLALAQLGVCLIVNVPIDQYVLNPYNNMDSKDFNLGEKPE